MGLFSKKPEISVCIPVFGTENVLKKCLDSVGKQIAPEGVKNFLEVIVVDDCSPDGSAGKIVRDFEKQFRIPVQFIRHQENKGLVEARRSAVYEAKGNYIFHLDSDDTLPGDALKILYQKAVETDADIVHGSADVYFFNPGVELEEFGQERLETYREDRERRVQNVHEGRLYGDEILNGYLLEKNFCGFLWGKLYKRDLYLDAFEHIPPIFNTMAEDVVQFIWLARLAKSYVGVKACVYNYFINTGVSSNKRICDLKSWERVCSTASVFTALFTEFENMEEGFFTSKQIEAVKMNCRGYLYNNLDQFHSVVDDSIKNEAYELLCEYWGEDFVKNINEKFLKKSINFSKISSEK